ncbi:hypothetical protein B808_226 [Fructilactobacillus florum 8D]|uniref:Uncharacterized protein n=1 Tax=Fructilactobacillus florum 8D TaxID=1221538 RepID=W9EFJ5_9LACO|nr:hypothetical protein B808_226 [Fructilactobacillus florum 8D]
MLITIVVNRLITIFPVKINSEFMTKFISETENSFDKKYNLKNQ